MFQKGKQSILRLLPQHHRPPQVTHLVGGAHKAHGVLLMCSRGFTIITSCPPHFPIPPVNEDFLDITEYLIDMEKTDVYNLGLVLGLSQHKLMANIDSKSFLDDVISAWLRKEDQVIKRGEPSWAVLIMALKHRRVGQTGIASNIAKDKGLLL